MQHSASTDSAELRIGPAPAGSLEALGIPQAVVVDTLLRRTYADQKSSVLKMANALGIGPMLVEQVVQELRAKTWLEITGSSGRDLVFSLTERGGSAVKACLENSRYVGVLPVSITEYSAQVRLQSDRRVLTREDLRRSFGDLVISDEMLDKLGPSLVSAGAIFLYGPAGTGKTSIAERMIAAYEDVIAIPHAVEVDGQIVRVFDPVDHEPIEPQPSGVDPRWMICQRPCIIAGGELTPDMLNLAYDQASGVHIPSLQMKANNGIFVIDDFGRQAASPEVLLNRWIVPLERQVDYLYLVTGNKFEVPFETKIVISTNMAPEDLGDEAFLRRIQNKVFVGPLQAHEFQWVLARTANAMGVELQPGIEPLFQAYCEQRGGGELRAYLPRDICKLIKSIAAYDRVAPVMNEETLARAAALCWAE